MKEVVINTRWKGKGAEADPYRPAIMDEHGLQDWVDTSGMSTAQIKAAIKDNAGVGGRIKCTVGKAKLDTIKADPKYGNRAVSEVKNVGGKDDQPD